MKEIKQIRDKILGEMDVLGPGPCIDHIHSLHTQNWPSGSSVSVTGWFLGNLIHILKCTDYILLNGKMSTNVEMERMCRNNYGIC